MKQSKKTRLQRAGWKVGDVREFLGLSDEELAFIENKVAPTNSDQQWNPQPKHGPKPLRGESK